MNLAETKKALEESVQKILKQSLNEGTEVEVNYDANEGVVFANITRQETDEKSGRMINTIYNLRYKEGDAELSILPYQRIVAGDKFGVAFCDTQPVAVSNKFLNDLIQLIIIGTDMVYNPDKYSAPEAEATEEIKEEEAPAE